MYVKEMTIKGRDARITIEADEGKLSIVEAIDNDEAPGAWPNGITTADVEKPREVADFCRKVAEFIERRHDDRGNDDAKIELQLLLTPLIRVAQLDAAAGY